MEKKPTASGAPAGIAAALIFGVVVLAAIGIFAYRQVNNYLASTNTNQQPTPQATPIIYAPTPAQTPVFTPTPLTENINSNANMSNANMNSNMYNSNMYNMNSSNMNRNANVYMSNSNMSNSNMNSNMYAPAPRADIDPPQANIRARNSQMFHSSQSSLGRILNYWEDHNVYAYGLKGMRIHIEFEAYGDMVGSPCYVSAYFSDGSSLLKDYNGKYRSEDGYVAVTSSFEPIFENSYFKNFTLFFPYDELDGAVGNLAYGIMIYTKNGTVIARIDSRSFTFTR